MPAATIEVKDKASQRAVDVVVGKLRRRLEIISSNLYTYVLLDSRQIFGSHEAALETVLLLRQVVAAAKFNTIDQLLDMVRRVGRRLVEAQPRGRLQHVSSNYSYLAKFFRGVRTECGEHCSKSPQTHSR
jgi:hypothetical protein